MQGEQRQRSKGALMPGAVLAEVLTRLRTAASIDSHRWRFHCRAFPSSQLPTYPGHRSVDADSDYRVASILIAVSLHVAVGLPVPLRGQDRAAFSQRVREHIKEVREEQRHSCRSRQEEAFTGVRERQRYMERGGRAD